MDKPGKTIGNIVSDTSTFMDDMGLSMAASDNPLYTLCTSVVCNLYVFNVPKVLEQMSNIWTRLEVGSAHTTDVVCLAFVCVCLRASVCVCIGLRACAFICVRVHSSVCVCVRLRTSVCVCEPSAVKSNFRQYLS